MTLRLHYHPLSSFCWKALVALYENATPFEPVMVDYGEAASREAFFGIAPLKKIPVLEDTDAGRVVPEVSAIIEYLDLRHPGPVRFIPADPELALQVRLTDRVFDLHVQVPMQKIVTDNIRPDGQRDPFGVEQARGQLAAGLGVIEAQLADGRTWAAGEAFTLADCAGAPALFYADKVAPLAGAYPAAQAYLERLKARPSFARSLAEAEPYFKYFPG